MKIKSIILVLSIVCAILLVPFIAMQFTNEVNWTLFDFLVAAALLSVTGFGITLILSNIKSRTSKLFLCVAVLSVFFLTWVELAVGIFN